MSGSKIVRISRAGTPSAVSGQSLSDPPELPALDEALETGPTRRDPDDTAFLPAALAILETPPRRSALIAAWTLVIATVGLIVGGCFAKTTLYAMAPGFVTSIGGTKVVQSQEGGPVLEIRAHDGEHVQAGDVLVALDPTDAIAQRTLVAGRLADARGRSERLTVEIAAIHAGNLDPPPPIAWSNDIPESIRARETEVMRGDLTRLVATFAELDAQREAKQAARDGYTESIAHQRSLIATTGEHLQIHQTLTRLGVESRYKVLTNTAIVQRQQLDLTELETKRTDTIAAIVRIEAARVKARAILLDQDQQALATAEREQDDLRLQLVGADKRVADMTLRAPVAGIVTASAVTTVGQMARPGQQLMQVVPDDAPLRVQAYVLNTDIGYIRPGQPVSIKIDTFPYTRYGVVHGTVTAVSSDAMPGSQALLEQKNESTAVAGGTLSATAAAQHASDLVFQITITPSESGIRIGDRVAPLLPGMSLVAEVETGRQPVIAWILYPLARGFGLTG